MAQFWGNDDFLFGATTYGTHPDLYLTVVPWATSPEGTTGLALADAAADLFDGYQLNAGASSGRAAFSPQGAASGFAGWAVERRNERTNVEVSAVPQIVVDGGALDAESFVQFGVCAYVSGGTVVTPGADTAKEYREDVSGYFLIEGKAASTRHRLVLLEVAAGSITVLGSQNVSELDRAHLLDQSLNSRSPRPLRLTVTPGAGSSVTLAAFRVAEDGTERQAFGGGIVRGTALAAGRAGFGAQVARTTTSGQVSTVIVDRFAIRSADGTTTHFEDEFRRSTRAAGLRHTDARFTGASLASAWTGDGKSRAPTTALNITKELRRTSPARAATGTDPSDGRTWPGFFLRQHPEETPSQRYAASFSRVNSETGIVTDQGILLRFSAIPFPSGLIDLRGRFPANSLRADYFKVGYAVTVEFDDAVSGDWTLRIRHFDGSQASNYESELLASASLSALGLALGTSFELDVEIRSFDGDTIGVGPFVAILAKVDSTTITPVPTAGLAGIVEVDDYLIDSRSVVTTGAGAAGVYMSLDSLAASDIVEVLSFEARTLTVPPVTDPVEQETEAIPTEVDSKSGTLSIPMDSLEESIVSGERFNRFENGAVGTLRTTSKDRHLWSVSATLVGDEWAALRSLHESNGVAIPFDWVHPFTGETFAVFFNSPSLEFQTLTINATTTAYAVSFDLIEAHAATLFN